MNLASTQTAHFIGVSRGSSAATTLLSMKQLAQLSGVGETDLGSLIDFGVLSETMTDHEPATFDLGIVMTLQRAHRLRQDLALDDHGFALAVMFLRQVCDLEEEIRLMRSDAEWHLVQPAVNRQIAPILNVRAEGRLSNDTGGRYRL